MNIKWKDVFLDPETKKALSLEIKKIENEEILEGALISPDKKTYRIIRGIPRFIPDKFYAKRTEKVHSDTVQTARSFGNKWRENASRFLGHSKAERELLKEQFLAMLGCYNINELKNVFKKGQTCLNAGCGVAWSEDLFNVNPETKRFAVDISLSVETAYERTKNIPNALVAQADIFNLPYNEHYFDIIFSDGVIHHTSNPRKAFNTLCKHLKPGGLIGIYVYKKKPFLREIADKEIRKLTTEMDFNDCLFFSKQITALGKALQNINQPLIIKEDIPLLNINAGRYNLQKFIYDHLVKCFFNKKLGDEISILTNADWYHPKYASHHTREEIQSWFDGNGLENVRFIQPQGWEHSGYFVSGRKII